MEAPEAPDHSAYCRLYPADRRAARAAPGASAGEFLEGHGEELVERAQRPGDTAASHGAFEAVDQRSGEIGRASVGGQLPGVAGATQRRSERVDPLLEARMKGPLKLGVGPGDAVAERSQKATECHPA